jgi:hypothetical protein
MGDSFSANKFLLKKKVLSRGLSKLEQVSSYYLDDCPIFFEIKYFLKIYIGILTKKFYMILLFSFLRFCEDFQFLTNFQQPIRLKF